MENNQQTSPQESFAQTQQPAQAQPQTNGNRPAKSGKSGKVKKKMQTFALIILGGSIAVFAITLAIALTVGRIGNIAMLISGVIELGLGVFVFKYFDWKIKYTCPECGAKRTHHRIYVDTEEKDETNSVVHKTTYNHIYNDEYVCPNCGETSYYNNIKKYGGTYKIFTDGHVEDTRQAPKEF